MALSLAFAMVGVSGAVARAAALSPSSFGFEVTSYSAAHLSTGSAAGVGVARYGVFDSGDGADSAVAALAAVHLRLYPILGVPCAGCSRAQSPSPSVAASELAQIITAFARRYGPNGTFWATHPQLPYLPVQSFEIGNEPNLPTKWVVDTAHLHWDAPAGPAAYAEVYNAARSALHAVDPTGVAVVGGLADSAKDGVDVRSDEQWLAPLTSGGVDAVGYHSWVFDVSNSLLESDTASLRAWMNGHGLSGVPLDVNEFGACQVTSQTTDNNVCPVSQSSATWGSAASSYIQWALCTPSMGVESVQPFSWGEVPNTDKDVFLALFSSGGTATAYGQDYLNLVKKLTTTGCPVSPSGAPPGSPTAAPPAPKHPLSSMHLRILRVRRHGRSLRVTVWHVPGSGRVVVIAYGRGRRRLHRRLSGGRPRKGSITFTAKVRPGRWTVVVSGDPARGYALPRRQLRYVKIPR
jgi:hypothetical protein